MPRSGVCRQLFLEGRSARPLALLGRLLKSGKKTTTEVLLSKASAKLPLSFRINRLNKEKTDFSTSWRLCPIRTLLRVRGPTAKASCAIAYLTNRPAMAAMMQMAALSTTTLPEGVALRGGPSQSSSSLVGRLGHLADTRAEQLSGPVFCWLFARIHSRLSVSRRACSKNATPPVQTTQCSGRMQPTHHYPSW